MPWQKSSPEQKRRSREEMMKKECHEHGFSSYSPNDGWKGFGPVSDALLEIETDRLIKVYKSLRENGFQDKFGYTTAGLFIAEKDYFVHPVAGWHRIAAMIALGYEAIPIRFKTGSKQIRRGDYAYWPGVRAGLFSESEALEIFDKRFRPYQ